MSSYSTPLSDPSLADSQTAAGVAAAAPALEPGSQSHRVFRPGLKPPLPPAGWSPGGWSPAALASEPCATPAPAFQGTRVLRVAPPLPPTGWSPAGWQLRSPLSLSSQRPLQSVEVVPAREAVMWADADGNVRGGMRGGECGGHAWRPCVEVMCGRAHLAKAVGRQMLKGCGTLRGDRDL